MSGSASGSQDPQRLLSLDVFRGITIAGMVLVNSPGNDAVYAPLRHADWNGWTATDLIFPSFLVILGVSICFSLGRRLGPEPHRAFGITPPAGLNTPRRARAAALRAALPHILWRAAVIFTLGLLISRILFHPHPGIRITGVLQRISACYLLGALLFLAAGPAAQAWTCLALLIGYWLLMTRLSVPGIGAGVLTPEGNFASYWDRRLLQGHIYTLTHDPEGLLSTFPAVATTLLGVLAGEWLRSLRTERNKAAGLFLAGLACAAAGRLWAVWFPLNKNIWTSSYALFAGGWALVGIALCYWSIEVEGWRGWGKPFEMFGRNALLAYFLSGLFYGVQEFVSMPLADGSSGNLKLRLCELAFGGWLSPINASLAYALAYTALCWGLMAFLYRRRIFLKI